MQVTCWSSLTHDRTDYFYDTFRPDLYNEGGVARVLLELEEP